jgi:hypothetical protein
VKTALALVTAAALALPAAAAGQATPGPPPGNGGDLPAPPGTAPAVVPPGTPAAIPAGATGPGLLSGAPVRYQRGKRRFVLRFACQASGTVRVRGRGVRGGTFASRAYRCSGNRATVTFKLRRKQGRRVARRARVAATAAVRQSGRTTNLDFDLLVRGRAPATPGFWTDGRLQCSADGSGAPPAYLITPDFTTRESTPISTRGWIAWFTQAGGWHWLGLNGERENRWDTWTATPSGIAQFHPNGQRTPVPFSWGPIDVPPGQGITAIGVYEIVYWVGGRPDHQWQYVNAGTTGAAAAGGGTLACSYP